MTAEIGDILNGRAYVATFDASTGEWGAEYFSFERLIELGFGQTRITEIVVPVSHRELGKATG